jgi:hypothetical protein
MARKNSKDHEENNKMWDDGELAESRVVPDAIQALVDEFDRSLNDRQVKRPCKKCGIELRPQILDAAKAAKLLNIAKLNAEAMFHTSRYQLCDVCETMVRAVAAQPGIRRASELFDAENEFLAQKKYRLINGE